MDLKSLKTSIESKNSIPNLIIFKGSHTFIANQYISAILKLKNISLEYVDNLEFVNSKELDIFGFSAQSNNLKLYKVDSFEFEGESLLTDNLIVIICKKIDNHLSITYKDYIVELNELEEWQIQDYLYSILSGVDRNLIDWLIKRFDCNIDRLQLEADKLLLFEENERNIILNQMIADNAFSDCSEDNIFDFTDSIVKKDITRLANIYRNINVIDIEAIGVHTIMYKNFIKLLQVWLSNNPTTQSTGLSSKQIYAISKLPRVWSAESLVSIVEFLTGIDYKIKTGMLPVPLLRDYIVVNILSR